MIVDYIDAHRGRFGVNPICRVLTTSTECTSPRPPTTPARKRARSSAAMLAEAYDAHAVYLEFTRQRSSMHHRAIAYGVRKMWHAMWRAGHMMGRDQVARLMGISGISGAVRGTHRTVTTRREDKAPRYPDHGKRQ